jgi:ATP-dependent RNA helicase RhlE
MSFDSLGLAPELLQAVRDCGYTVPTPIQEQAIPHLLAGRDMMGCAQTGTGKTAAFALPILHQMRGTPPGHLRALVLVPTRELAIQVGRSIREFGEPLGLRSTAVYGGVPIAPQEMMLRHGVDVLVATPGRLKDHIWRGLIDFRETCFLVLDEADRMLDMGFIDAVREIVALIPRERQTMLFSATLDPAIVRLAKDILKDPVRVAVAPSATVADGIEHVMVAVHSGSKKNALLELIRRHQMFRTLVFTRTRRGASRLAIDLKRDGHRVSSIHSDKTQTQRLDALEAFREGTIDFLVATDIAARGLDVEGISHVVNFDLPRNAEDYVHRIGRTARAGHSGVAISLVGPEDGGSVRSIEQLIGRALSAEVGRGIGQEPAELMMAGGGGARSIVAVGQGMPLGPRQRGGSPVAARGVARARPASIRREEASRSQAIRREVAPRPLVGPPAVRREGPFMATAVRGAVPSRSTPLVAARGEEPARIVRRSGVPPQGAEPPLGNGDRPDRGPQDRPRRGVGRDEAGPRFERGRREDTPRPSDRLHGSAPRRDSGRDSRHATRREMTLAPSRGYQEKESPLRRVLSRLGFSQPR